jgi:hypothetical protein
LKLSIRVLTCVVSVNDYGVATEMVSTAGDPIDLWFQLVDDSKNLSSHGFSPPGLRYCPLANSTLQVTFLNLNNRNQFTRFASQPLAQDPSIFKVSILATDPVSGTVSCKFVLTEPSGAGTITKTCSLNACFLVDGTDTVGNPRSTLPYGF